MTLDELIDGAWEELRPNMFRRALLGKQRCSELVMLTCVEFSEESFRGCQQGSAHDKATRADLINRVADRYRAKATTAGEPYGMVFLSVVLLWAVSAIVQYVVIQWWKKHFDAAALRQQYGWRDK